MYTHKGEFICVMSYTDILVKFGGRYIVVVMDDDFETYHDWYWKARLPVSSGPDGATFYHFPERSNLSEADVLELWKYGLVEIVQPEPSDVDTDDTVADYNDTVAVMGTRRAFPPPRLTEEEDLELQYLEEEDLELQYLEEECNTWSTKPKK
jgi:hypothetical protein